MLRVKQAVSMMAAVAGLFAASATSGAQESAAVATGRSAFQACAACHADKAGVVRMGPSLAGVFGRPAAQMSGFHYSTALTNANLRWDRKTLDDFIAHPRAVVPGTKMIYPGIGDPARRRLIIDYLESLK